MNNLVFCTMNYAKDHNWQFLCLLNIELVSGIFGKSVR
jgi:hypothetical protein